MFYEFYDKIEDIKDIGHRVPINSFKIGSFSNEDIDAIRSSLLDNILSRNLRGLINFDFEKWVSYLRGLNIEHIKDRYILFVVDGDYKSIYHYY